MGEVDLQVWDHAAEQDPTWTEGFMDVGGQGDDHPSRLFVTAELKKRGIGSLVDLACGPGVTYRQLRSGGYEGSYIGVDKTRACLDKAWERGAPGLLHTDVLSYLDEFHVLGEVLHMRHILEHLPLQDAYTAFSRALELVAAGIHRQLVVVFFIPPGEEKETTLGEHVWNNTLSRNALLEAVADVDMAVEVTEFADSRDSFGGNEVWWITCPANEG